MRVIGAAADLIIRSLAGWLAAGLVAVWVLLWVAAFQPLPAVAQQPTPSPSEMDLCRQQLAAAHDAADTRERKMFLALAEQNAAAEARQATLIEWLKAAQAGAKP